ncbi:hypothetical protein D9M69_727940 [compost metagenome]
MTVIAAIAQMLAVERHVVVIEKTPDFLQKTDVQRRRPTEGQGQTVTGQWIAFRQGPQCRAVGTADADPVFRCDFQKVEIACWCDLEVFE